MPSYANVTSNGPEQPAADKAAAPVAEVIDHSAEAARTADVGSQLNVVDSGFKERDVKTETQAKGRELANEAEDKAKRAEAKIKEEAGKAKEGAKKAGKKAEHAVVAAGQDERTYQILNALVVAGLGFAGYQRYQAGRLDVTHVGIGALGLGLLVGVEGVVKRWFNEQH